MINGKVIQMQARTDVIFCQANQDNIEIEFIIDTGFEGALALSPNTVNLLGLKFYHEIYSVLADDSSIRTDVYAATILWKGAELEVAVLAMGQRPLLGTALLEKMHLGIDFMENGVVRISDISQ